MVNKGVYLFVLCSYRAIFSCLNTKGIKRLEFHERTQATEELAHDSISKEFFLYEFT